MTLPPTTSELLEAGQSVQSAEPVNILYLPVAHAVQGPPSGPLYPALQRHDVMSGLPTADMLLAGQAVQVAEPAIVLNVPATHVVHVHARKHELSNGGYSTYEVM